ncbi:MAG: urate hydroxylase PuuD [Candidatus Lambdaproteobacteria bacterium]|nr:urate hydroxylase PuuD [Candidatus Lambdaproteobacteria bacterium]
MSTWAVTEFVLRWIHFLAGITWIGLLYYFNFVQAPFMAGAGGPTKLEVTTKLLPRALWWFRWGAMVTAIAGVLILWGRATNSGWGYFGTHQGIMISIGSLLGLIMWFNVWFIIWPNQQVIIAANEEAMAKGQAPQGLGNRPRVAFLASRTNTMLSIPMLFFMAASSHLPW